MLDILQAQERSLTQVADELRSRLAVRELEVRQKDTELEELRVMVRRLQLEQDGIVGCSAKAVPLPEENVTILSGGDSTCIFRTPRNSVPLSRSGSCDTAARTDDKRCSASVCRQSSSVLLNSPRQALVFNGLVLPYVPPMCFGHKLSEKYQVNWHEPLHIGMLSGLLGSSAQLEGIGGLGTIFRAKVRAHSGLRAVKVIRKEHIAYPKFFQQQVADLHNMEHQSLCRFQDVFEDSNCLYIVFDYCAGPTILEKILSDPQYCERDAAAAFKVLLQALAYLHEHQIVHQNLHLDSLRFMVSPQPTKPRSSYGDQLKVLNLGHMLHVKHLSAVMSGLEPLPFLPVRSIQAHSSSCCMPPEYSIRMNGIRSYAQLASVTEKCRSTQGSPAMVSRMVSHRLSISRSTSNLEAPSLSVRSLTSDSGSKTPVPAGGGSSPRSSPKSGSFRNTRSRSQENVSRQAREIFKLLQAGDMWAAGCILHVLLTGVPPSKDIHTVGWKMSPLEAVSASARDLCLSLLRKDPQQRASAAEALRSDWFGQGEIVRNVHRSQTKGQPISVSAPIAALVKTRMAKYSSVCQLRRVVTITSALLKDEEEAAKGLLPPTPLPADAPEKLQAEVPVSDVKVAVDFLAREAFRNIMWGRTAVASGCLPLQDLLEIVEGANQSCDMPWKKPLGVLMQMTPILKASGLSADQFVEFIRAVCQ
jgi:serine/threonine protein kinase